MAERSPADPRCGRYCWMPRPQEGFHAVPSPYNNDVRAKTFTLPVSGSVVLYGPEIDVVQTRSFQRLGGIKQLGTSYVVFRAHFTRGSSTPSGRFTRRNA